MVEVFAIMTGRLLNSLARGAFVCLGFLLVIGVLDPGAASARSHGYPHAARAAHNWAYAHPRASFQHARFRAGVQHFRARVAFHHARPRSVFRYARPQAVVQSGVITEASRYIGAGNVTGMRGPWCADYASMVLRHTGRRPLASRTAASALAYGPRVGQPTARRPRGRRRPLWLCRACRLLRRLGRGQGRDRERKLGPSCRPSQHRAAICRSVYRRVSEGHPSRSSGLPRLDARQAAAARLDGVKA